MPPEAFGRTEELHKEWPLKVIYDDGIGAHVIKWESDANFPRMRVGIESVLDAWKEQGVAVFDPSLVDAPFIIARSNTRKGIAEEIAVNRVETPLALGSVKLEGSHRFVNELEINTLPFFARLHLVNARAKGRGYINWYDSRVDRVMLYTNFDLSYDIPHLIRSTMKVGRSPLPTEEDISRYLSDHLFDYPEINPSTG